MRRCLAPVCLFGILMFILSGGSGCAELWVLFAPGGFFPPQSAGGTLAGGGGGGGGSGGGTGGTGTTIANPGTTIPTTTQPAAIAPPSYGVSLLDPLLEQTAGAQAVITADMDGDGLTDFVSASDENQPVQLHMRDPNSLEYATFSIAGGAPISRMINVAAADFDADGNPDVAVLVNDTGFVPVANASLRGAVVFLFAPADPADQLSWVQVTLSATFILPGDDIGMTDFLVGDFDGQDGPDVVLLSNEIDDIKNIYFYPNPGGGNARDGTQWQQFIINADAAPGQSLELGDIDVDGDLDVVATFPTAKSFNVRWLRNPLAEAGVAAVTAGTWTRRFVGQQQDGGEFISLGDIDTDGDIDVAVAHVTDGIVQWFDNPGPGRVEIQGFPWDVYNIGKVTSGVDINQIQLVDLNLDGQLDCYVTASGNMVGMQPGSELRDYWTPFSILATNPVAVIGLSAFIDANNDGLLDIVAPLNRPGLVQDQIVVFTRQGS